MAAADSSTQFAQWSAGGQLPRIEYALSVVEEICAEAVEGLYRFRHGGVEVGGVLFGHSDGAVVRVLDFRPLDCEHAFGPRFVLSERDLTRLKDLLYAGRDDESLQHLEPVGWYHSHTRSGIELSPRDLEIYDSYFPQRWQIALVVRPENFGTARAGFFVRGRDSVVCGGPSGSEFLIRPRRQPGERLEPAGPGREPEGAGQEVESGSATPAPARDEQATDRRDIAEQDQPEAGSAPEPELPGFARVQPGALRKRLWMLIPAALLVMAVLGAAQYYRLEGPAEPLSLWVADMGGQLLIEWDRTAKPVRQARSAILEIQDGRERTDLKIDGERLREGSVDYVRRSDIVDVRLRVNSPYRQVSEYIRFVGPPTRRGLSAEEAEALRQTDALKAEVASLRAQLEAKNAELRRARAARVAR